MDLILAKANGEQVRVIRYPVLDCDCNGNNKDFSLSIPASEWDGSITYGMRLFVPGEEYGGIVGEITTETELSAITVSGHTWRGLLSYKVIEPPAGEDHMIVSGDVSDILRILIGDNFSGAIVAGAGQLGITVSNYKFKRYCTLLDGLNDMLSSVGCRLDLRYDEMTDRLIVSAVRVVDFSPDIELSQDYALQFKYDEIRNKPNHLIIGGKGELHEREILHLYTDPNGNIGKTQYYFGIDEVVEFWDNTSSEELEKDGRKHFREIMNSSKLTMDIDSIPDTARIGDIVGGRDYITGKSMKAPIENVILQINGDIITKSYKLEAEK